MCAGVARPSAYAAVDGREVAKPSERQRVILPEELRCHCSPQDCWVSVFGVVYDLTPLIALNKNELSLPLIESAGTDISSWFCRETMQPQAVARVRSDAAEVYVHPKKPFLHVPGSLGCTDTPWWRDEKYVMGLLADACVKVKLINALTRQETELSLSASLPLRETLHEQLRDTNAHADAYSCSCLGRALDLDKTLQQNGIELLPQPTILLHFEDDIIAL